MKWLNETQDSSGKQLKKYTQWCSMKNRHLSKNNKPYVNVTVCNNFMNYDYYCDWAVNQKGWLNDDVGNRIWSIDKDIVGNGLEYNEESCVFVPAILNIFNKYTPTGTTPRGIEHTVSGKYKVTVKKFGNKHRSELFLSMEDSIVWYFKERLSYLSDLKSIYSDRVDERVFNCLLNKMYDIELNNLYGYEDILQDIRDTKNKTSAAAHRGYIL